MKGNDRYFYYCRNCLIPIILNLWPFKTLKYTSLTHLASAWHHTVSNCTQKTIKTDILANSFIISLIYENIQCSSIDFVIFRLAIIFIQTLFVVSRAINTDKQNQTSQTSMNNLFYFFFAFERNLSMNTYHSFIIVKIPFRGGLFFGCWSPLGRRAMGLLRYHGEPTTTKEGRSWSVICCWRVHLYENNGQNTQKTGVNLLECGTNLKRPTVFSRTSPAAFEASSSSTLLLGDRERQDDFDAAIITEISLF